MSSIRLRHHATLLYDHTSRILLSHPMKICIVGLGYVGLPAACVLAQAGHTVVGVDVRSDVVAGLNQGRVHIDEPGISQ